MSSRQKRRRFQQRLPAKAAKRRENLRKPSDGDESCPLSSTMRRNNNSRTQKLQAAEQKGNKRKRETNHLTTKQQKNEDFNFERHALADPQWACKSPEHQEFFGYP